MSWNSGKAEVLYPDGRYSVDFIGPCFRQVDHVAWPIVEFLQSLPDFKLERLRDVIEISVAGANGIVVIVTDAKVEIRLADFEWHGHAPVQTSKLWKELRAEEVLTLPRLDLMHLLFEALRERQTAQRRCKYCKRSFPPEFGDEHTQTQIRNGREVEMIMWVCHGCQEKHLGVAH